MKVCNRGLKTDIDFVALPPDGKMDSKETRKQRESLTGSLIGIYWRVCFRGVGYIYIKKHSTKFPCSSKQPPTHALTDNHNQTKWIRSKQIKAKIPIQFKGN